MLEERCHSWGSSVFCFGTDNYEFIVADQWTWHQPCQQFLDRLSGVQSRGYTVISKHVRGNLNEYMIGNKKAENAS